MAVGAAAYDGAVAMRLYIIRTLLGNLGGFAEAIPHPLSWNLTVRSRGLARQTEAIVATNTNCEAPARISQGKRMVAKGFEVGDESWYRRERSD